jgi:hypothetical protein
MEHPAWSVDATICLDSIIRLTRIRPHHPLSYYVVSRAHHQEYDVDSHQSSALPTTQGRRPVPVAASRVLAKSSRETGTSKDLQVQSRIPLTLQIVYLWESGLERCSFDRLAGGLWGLDEALFIHWRQKFGLRNGAGWSHLRCTS